ncbi:hypothetical protein [Aeromicrobium sp. 179-A 4D2 NHS]|uniref:hypothetical protein n=1 Tax=Aeromicrobium sp. 179-A 4D2 NHS TaxID=3142375 RepID=UPI0039A1B912
MRRAEVVAAGMLASLVCGVLCAWGAVAMLVGLEELSSSAGEHTGAAAVAATVLGLLLLLFLATGLGVVVGGLLGLGPTAVVVLVWGPLQARLGADRAVTAASAVAGAVVAVEMLLLWDDGEGGLGATPVPAACAVIAVPCAWVALGSALRSARARPGATAY